jgi:perosamine synthetase
LKDQLGTGQLDTGPRVEQFEREVAEFLDVPAGKVVAVSSCTAALQLALEAIGVKNRSVLCPNNTWVAVPSAIMAAGGKPLISDIPPRNAIPRIVCHLYGESWPVPLMSCPGDLIIEDCAHAFGAPFAKGPHTSRFRCFSFAPTKILTTIYGGLLVCRYEDDARWARVKARQGTLTNRKGFLPGYHFNMSDVSAAIGLSQLPFVNARLQRRSEIARKYLEEPEIKKRFYQQEKEDFWRIMFYFPVMVPKRNQVRDELAQRGIETSVHYHALSEQPAYSEFAGKRDVIGSEHGCRKLLSLPMYATMTDKQVEYVRYTFAKIVKRVCPF